MATPIPDELLVGHRLAVDQEFAERLHESEFSSMEWDLIMSTVSFEMEEPDDPEAAAIVPNVEELPAAISAIEDLPDAGPGVHGGPDRAGGSGGIVDRLTSRFGITGDEGPTSPDARRRAATALVTEYAEVLQIHLKQQRAWTALCDRLADDGD